MSKYSDLNAFLNGLDDVSTAGLNAKIALMVNADSSRAEMARDRIKGHTEDSLKSKLMCMLYADHVTTELQAENAALRAKVEELESEQSFKNGMKDLLLQAMASKSETPMYPVDLETEDGSFIKAVIAIKIQSVGVAK